MTTIHTVNKWRFFFSLDMELPYGITITYLDRFLPQVIIAYVYGLDPLNSESAYI